MSVDIGNRPSALLTGLSGFWQRYFKDIGDIEAYYQAAEVYLGQTYLDLMSTILNIGIIDAPVFNKEDWKLFLINETDLNFKAGYDATTDRYMYDPPNTEVDVNLFQNTILAPTVVLEKNVDFETINNDGYIRFVSDPFRQDIDENGKPIPKKGIAWRTVKLVVGNALLDTYGRNIGNGIDYYDYGVRRGDTLRILASCRKKVAEGLTGSVVVTPTVVKFLGGGAHQCTRGDVIEIYSWTGPDTETNRKYKCCLIVKEVPGTPGLVYVEPAAVGCPVFSSTVSLHWRLWKAEYYPSFKDYEIDYIDDQECALVGSIKNPYPLDSTSLLVYACVRTPDDNYVTGVDIAFEPTGSLLLPKEFNLNQTHIDVGSVDILAYKIVGSEKVALQEGVDYRIDYLRGILYQLEGWDPGSLGRLSFTYQQQLLQSGSGVTYLKEIGTVKQISLWSSQVTVDKFNLWYNYGYLINRFGASSEHYKAFLRGVMQLYVYGPIFERLESAINVAAGYPVIQTEAELLKGYFNGINAEGDAAEISGADNTIKLPLAQYELQPIDIGGRLIILNSISAANNNAFVIESIDYTTNTARVESPYGLLDETGLSWVLSRNYRKEVTTTYKTYTFPYYVPIKEELTDPANIDKIILFAFDSLTDAFTVTDYIEDPTWWHNKLIPPALWEDSDISRRFASTKLYEHILGAEDNPRLGDPGLYYGAGSDGLVVNPVDGDGNPVPFYRNKAAFVLFDQWLKMHMFYVKIAEDLQLDTQFKDDLDEIILVVKPAYTYPYVEPNSRFYDSVGLKDLFSIPEIGLDFSQGIDSGNINGNALIMGDSSHPVFLGDFYRYARLVDTVVPGAPAVPIVTGMTVSLGAALPSGSRYIALTINGTAGGMPLQEGVDYTFNWRLLLDNFSPNPNAWVLEALTDWDGSSFPTITASYVIMTNGAYNTLLGDTPIAIGGSNPAYIRATALNPDDADFWDQWVFLRTEYVDRSIQLTVNDGGLSYTY